VLVFGVNDDMRAAYDFTRIDLPLELVIRETERCGGVAVPCHPGGRASACAHTSRPGAWSRACA